MSTQVFPSLPGIAFPVKRTPQWKTRVQQAISGKETRIADWSAPRWLWELTYDHLVQGTSGGATRTDFAQLAAFFNGRQGMFDSFLFTDSDDNAVATQPLGAGDGATTSFQLVRAFGGFVEPVLNVQAGPFVKVAGVATSAFTLSFATYGVITFTSPPANGAALTWSGTFAFLCRFDEDQAEFTKFMQPIWEQKGLKFSSIKV